MSQHRKIKQLEQLIVDTTKVLERVKAYEQETQALDSLMLLFKKFKQDNFLFEKQFDFEAVIVEDNSIKMYEPYIYEMYMHVPKPKREEKTLGYSFNYINSLNESLTNKQLFYVEMQKYEEELKKVKKHMVEIFLPFEKFIHEHFNIDLESRNKKVIATTQEYAKVFFLQEFNWALMYKMDFEKNRTIISLESKDDPYVIKQFDKALLNSYLEKTQLENAISDVDSATQTKKKSTLKI